MGGDQERSARLCHRGHRIGRLMREDRRRQDLRFRAEQVAVSAPARPARTTSANTIKKRPWTANGVHVCGGAHAQDRPRIRAAAPAAPAAAALFRLPTPSRRGPADAAAPAAYRACRAPAPPEPRG
jgi:hypothetical protein